MPRTTQSTSSVAQTQLCPVAEMRNQAPLNKQSRSSEKHFRLFRRQRDAWWHLVIAEERENARLKPRSSRSIAEGESLLCRTRPSCRRVERRKFPGPPSEWP